MSTVEQIEAAVRQLSPEDGAKFRAWFAEIEAQEWDWQLESDMAAGRLNWLVDEAREDKRADQMTDRRRLLLHGMPKE
jgi:hypothetical protein